VGAEVKLYKKLKAKTPKIIWNRVENLAIPGMPDLLGYNTNGHFITVELKVTRSNRLKFSPHQIAFHVRHPNNSFILTKSLVAGHVKLYEGKKILQLVASGLRLDACCLGLEACRLRLESVGAC